MTETGGGWDFGERDWLAQIRIFGWGDGSIHATGRSLSPGANTGLTVAVGGTNPLCYQWLLNGTNIANATNVTLTLNNIQVNNTGNYSIIVTNDYGTTTSAMATLTVLMQPNSYGLSNMTGTNVTLQLASPPRQHEPGLGFHQPAEWQVAGTVIVDGNGFAQFTDTNVLSKPLNYYRLSNPGIVCWDARRRTRV